MLLCLYGLPLFSSSSAVTMVSGDDLVACLIVLVALVRLVLDVMMPLIVVSSPCWEGWRDNI